MKSSAAVFYIDCKTTPVSCKCPLVHHSLLQGQGKICLDYLWLPGHWFSDTSRSYSSCHEQKLHSVNQRGDLDKLEAGRVANANAKSVFITTSLSIVTGGAAVGII